MPTDPQSLDPQDDAVDPHSDKDESTQPQDGDAAAPQAGGDDPPEVAIVEWEDRWRRTAADFDNMKKRYSRDVERERESERVRVTSMWLPVVDNLELAIDHAGSGAGTQRPESSLIAGLQAVRDQAVQVLDRLGYPRQGVVGVPFDPVQHEVISVIDDPAKAPGTVAHVVKPGYGSADAQLRPASVVVTRPADQSASG